MKRSGETIEWGCQWDSGGLDIYDTMLRAVADGAVSNKFPHRVVELLDGYLADTTPLSAKTLQAVQNFPTLEVIQCEFQYALDRQGQQKKSPSFTALKSQAENLRAYLATARGNSSHLSNLSDPSASSRAATESSLRALIGLCQTVAFIARNLPGAPHAQTRSASRNPESAIPQPAERQPVS